MFYGSKFWSCTIGSEWCFYFRSSQNCKTKQKYFGLQITEWSPGFVLGFFFLKCPWEYIGGRHQEDIKIFSFQTKNLSQQQKLWKGNNAVVPGVNYGQSCLPTSSLQYI